MTKCDPGGAASRVPGSRPRLPRDLARRREVSLSFVQVRPAVACHPERGSIVPDRDADGGWRG